MVSISSDEELEEAAAFSKQFKTTFPVVHDSKAEIFEKYGVRAVPSNVIIDRKGRVVAAIEGADMKAIEAAVTRALAAR